MIYPSLLIIGYLLFLFLAAKNFKLATLLTLALLPTYAIRFHLFGLPLTFLEGLIWLLFIIFLINLKKSQNLTFNPVKIFKNLSSQKLASNYNPLPKNLRWPIIIFLLSATMAVFISPDLRTALGVWKAYFIDALFFLIIFIYTFKAESELRLVIKFLGLTALAIGLFALYQKLTGQFIPNPFWQAEATRRVTTFFGYPNANALFLAPVVILTFANLFKEKKFQSIIINLVIIILSVLTIYWSGSAGGLLAVAFGVLAILLFYRKTRLITLVIILLSAVGLWLTPPTKSYIQKIYISTSEKSLPQDPTDWQLRAQQWRETLEMLKDRPLAGAGLSGYQQTIEPYHRNKHIEIFLYPHNLILNFWSEIGLVGLLAFIWLIVVFFINLSRNQTANSCLKIALASAMITLLVHGLVDVPYFKNDLSVLFWVIIGCSIILTNNSKGRVA